MPGLTTRQRFEAHDMNACTGACHAAMDPIGYGFEHYDGIGRLPDHGPESARRFERLDHARRQDADVRGRGRGWRSCSPKARRRRPASPADDPLRAQPLGHAADAASIESAATRFKGSLNMRDLITGVATSRTFRYRAPAAGEVLP